MGDDSRTHPEWHLIVGLAIALIVLGAVFEKECGQTADLGLATGIFAIAGAVGLTLMTMGGFVAASEKGALYMAGCNTAVYLLVSITLSALTVHSAFQTPLATCDGPRATAIGAVAATYMGFIVVMTLIAACMSCAAFRLASEDSFA